MKKVLALVIAVMMLAAMTPLALAANATVYVSVSVDGKLKLAAQPVQVSDLTVNGVLKAAHAKYYSGGESGYAAGIDPTWNMFLISKAWGVSAVPYVIVNDAPLGADPSKPATADTAPVKDGDNIIVVTSSDPNVQPKVVSLTASVSGSSATVKATSWTLDFTTFTYSSAPLSGGKVIDPVTGSSLGTTDAKGSATVAIPESGIIAIEGAAAIYVGAPSAPAASASSAPAAGTSTAPSASVAPSPASSSAPAGKTTSAPAAGASPSAPAASAAPAEAESPSAEAAPSEAAAPAPASEAASPAAAAGGLTVYVSVSVDGKLQLAAQPVEVSEPTVDGALKAAHAKYYSGGESGYTAGIDKTWNMFLITKVWGVPATPYVIVNNAPLGSQQNPSTADAAPVKDGDNLIISVSSDPSKPAQAVSLEASLSGDSATVTATAWTLDFTTFQYSSAPLSGANVIDPATNASLGTTDANGSATVKLPESGVVAIEGLAAINVNAAAAAAAAAAPAPEAGAAPAAPAQETPIFYPPTTSLAIATAIIMIPIFTAIIIKMTKQARLDKQAAKK